MHSSRCPFVAFSLPQTWLRKPNSPTGAARFHEGDIRPCSACRSPIPGSRSTKSHQAEETIAYLIVGQQRDAHAGIEKPGALGWLSPEMVLASRSRRCLAGESDE